MKIHDTLVRKSTWTTTTNSPVVTTEDETEIASTESTLTEENTVSSEEMFELSTKSIAPNNDVHVTTATPQTSNPVLTPATTITHNHTSPKTVTSPTSAPKAVPTTPAQHVKLKSPPKMTFPTYLTRMKAVFEFESLQDINGLVILGQSSPFNCWLNAVSSTLIIGYSEDCSRFRMSVFIQRPDKQVRSDLQKIMQKYSEDL